MFLQSAHSDFSISGHVMIFISVACCLLSSLPSLPAGAMSARAGTGDRRNAAAMDKDLGKIVSSGVELMDVPVSSDDGQLGVESEEEEAPFDEAEGFFSTEKYHAAPSKRRLRFQKRYRLRNNKRRLRLQKRKQGLASDDAEYGRPEDSAYERDLREPRLRFHAHDVRKRSSWERGPEAEDAEREQQPRQRRSVFPAFSAASKRVPIGNDLQALADILYEEKQNQAYNEFLEYLKKIGRR